MKKAGWKARVKIVSNEKKLFDKAEHTLFHQLMTDVILIIIVVVTRFVS